MIHVTGRITRLTIVMATLKRSLLPAKKTQKNTIILALGQENSALLDKVKEKSYNLRKLVGKYAARTIISNSILRASIITA